MDNRFQLISDGQVVASFQYFFEAWVHVYLEMSSTCFVFGPDNFSCALIPYYYN